MGSQGAFQAAVCLAGGYRLAPLLPYLVVDGIFQVMKRGVHVRVNVLDAGEKPLEHLLHRVVQVADIFLHRLLEVFRAQIGGGDDRQRRFQLGGHILFEASGRQLDIPERHQHKADGQYGDEEGVPGKNGDAGAQGKQHQRCHAHHGEFSLPPGCGQYRLGFCDLRRKKPAFLRLVVSLMSARMLPGAAVSREKMLSLISAGEIPSTIKSPAIMPTQAISWIVVMQFPPSSG